MGVEQKAQKMGHISKEDWIDMGKDPDEWRSPEEFVERGENIVPIMRDRIDKLEKTIETLTKHVKTQVEKAEERALTEAKKSYEQEIARLKAERVKAVDDGDVEKFEELDNKINSLDPPQEPAGEKPAADPHFEAWHANNPWYAPDLDNVGSADRDMTIFALAVANDPELIKENLPPDKFYQRVEERVRANFPHKFQNKNREQVDMVESTTPAPPKTNGKTWADIPSDAKATYKRTAAELEREYGKDYVKENFTQEIFAKQYFEA